MKVSFVLFYCLLLGVVTEQKSLEVDDDTSEEEIDMHSDIYDDTDTTRWQPSFREEGTEEFWKQQAQQTLREHLAKIPNTGIAKNVILFLGDGMSISTITAARMVMDQKENYSGEENKLSFERLPYTGLSKTYCVDSQVSDSACTSTAYLCGVKANKATIGVTATVGLKDCPSMNDPKNQVHSIARWSQLEGKRTGLVTTTRVTHASPAGLYAHTAHRNWENDVKVRKDDFNPKECPDIAAQLLSGETGKNLNVILGGGRGNFLPKSQKDEDGHKGSRKDGRDLIQEWKSQKEGYNYDYVYNRTGLLSTSPKTDFLLGLFDKSHTKYNYERNPLKKPSLAEMTEAAIRVLAKEPKGYFLFVEGGLIDRAHHGARARAALNETIEFHKAVEKALNMTNSLDTLIVVTSDHSHTMTINGYPKRGSDIFGVSGTGSDKLPYTTISYANGPGYHKEEHGKRHDVSKDDLTDTKYRYPGLVPLSSESHAGEDVGIFARGPWAHLFTGVIEQNVIPHLMAYASCVGEGATVCKDRKKS